MFDKFKPLAHTDIPIFFKFDFGLPVQTVFVHFKPKHLDKIKTSVFLMSDNKDKLETKLADAKALAKDMLNARKSAVVVSQESVVEVAKKRDPKDITLWLLAVVALIAATLAPDYLSGVWAPANNTWVRIGMIVGLVVFALICLAFTNQGSAFKTLLKDAGIELRRIVWPSKEETTTYTWQVIVVTAIAGVLIWLLDNLFNKIVGFILG